VTIEEVRGKTGAEVQVHPDLERLQAA